MEPSRDILEDADGRRGFANVDKEADQRGKDDENPVAHDTKEEEVGAVLGIAFREELAAVPDAVEEEQAGQAKGNVEFGVGQVFEKVAKDEVGGVLGVDSFDTKEFRPLQKCELDKP